MEKLTIEQELQIAHFGDELTAITGPDDMFPPDGGVLETPNQLGPLPPLCDLVEVVFV